MSKYSQYESPGTTYIGHTYMRKYVMDNLGILYLVFGLSKVCRLYLILRASCLELCMSQFVHCMFHGF